MEKTKSINYDSSKKYIIIRGVKGSEVLIRTVSKEEV